MHSLIIGHAYYPTAKLVLELCINLLIIAVFPTLLEAVLLALETPLLKCLQALAIGPIFAFR